MRAVHLLAIIVVFLVTTAMGSRSPETCLLFEATSADAGKVRVGAAGIAKQSGLGFSDKSGEAPWQELVIYLQLAGNGVEAIAQQRRDAKGWICFYGQKDRKAFQELVRNFSEFFERSKIPFHDGRP